MRINHFIRSVATDFTVSLYIVWHNSVFFPQFAFLKRKPLDSQPIFRPLLMRLGPIVERSDKDPDAALRLEFVSLCVLFQAYTLFLCSFVQFPHTNFILY